MVCRGSRCAAIDAPRMGFQKLLPLGLFESCFTHQRVRLENLKANLSLSYARLIICQTSQGFRGFESHPPANSAACNPKSKFEAGALDDEA
jgi:hypothetical protein